ncbi:MAG: methylenetetrahydrofolate reductase [NAD(P)H], partial [Marinilabiliales bacterium]|nr:methylenetetrahydrofolate reductase [NAD(P)H] [Marinilabiliales bacterium]
MKVIDIINASSGTVFSFELLPPLKGQSASRLYETIDELVEFKPGYINLTTHRDEIEYRPLENGLLEKKIVRKRPGTVAIAAAIQHKYNIPVVPHVVCGGFTRDDTENMLIDLNFLGIKNVLALRGDGLSSEKHFQPEKNGHAHANELVEQIVHLKEGRYLDPELKNKSALDFCIGVAGYPEKHAEASNPDTDLFYLKQKVDAGADYIVTQMFFDNKKYFDFVVRCRKAGITVPIIPGIKPLALLNQITLLPKIFSIDIPEDFASEVRKCKTNEEARQVGTEWAILQAKELIAHHVPCLHIYTYGISDNTRQIAKTL